MFLNRVVDLKRKVFRRMNAYGLFYEHDEVVRLVVGGYTRSGTTFFSETLSSIIKARYIHEPLNPLVIGTNQVVFNERESAEKIRTSSPHRQEIIKIFSPGYPGVRFTNEKGGLFFYKGRIIKMVRANFYLNELARMFPEQKFAVLMRHPCACIQSRMRLGWSIPDISNCITDIRDELNPMQKELVNDPAEPHVKLAVTWCLDNIRLLSNRENSSFHYLFYENVVNNALEEFVNVLDFMGVDWRGLESRLHRELSLKRCDQKSAHKIPSWKNEMGREKLSDIAHVVSTFGLDYLYDLESGYPNDIF